jgi:hypothetical protein
MEELERNALAGAQYCSAMISHDVVAGRGSNIIDRAASNMGLATRGDFSGNFRIVLRPEPEALARDHS